jgi:hypothetical protein
VPASLYQQNMRKATTGPLSTEAAKPLQRHGILGAESGLLTYGNWPIVVAPASLLLTLAVVNLDTHCPLRIHSLAGCSLVICFNEVSKALG